MEQAIADYFQEVYGDEDRQMDDSADILLWERLERAAEANQGLFSDQDVVEAIKASNFNKGVGPDGFDGSILKSGDSSHPPTQVLSAQILGLLNKPMSIPNYNEMYEGNNKMNNGSATTAAWGAGRGDFHLWSLFQLFIFQLFHEVFHGLDDLRWSG